MIYWPTYNDGTCIIPTNRPSYMDRYAINLLVNEPNRINHMTEIECHAWLNQFKNKRIIKYKNNKISLTKIKTKIRQRIKDIKKAINQLNILLNKKELIEQYVDELNTITNTIINSNHIDIHRSLYIQGYKNRNLIFDLPMINIGYFSHDAYNQYIENKSSQLTDEHCYPRTWSAIELFKFCIRLKLKNPTKKITPRDILQQLCQSCIIIKTTSFENIKLIKYQHYKIFKSPAHSYKLANIKLIDTNKGLIIPWQWINLSNFYQIELSNIKIPHFCDVTTVQS